MRLPFVHPETPNCARAFRAAVRPPRGGWRVAFAVMAWFAAGVVALHAHRPHEATADFRWLHGRWEAQVVLPLPMATRLLADPEVPALRREDVPAQRARLVAVAEKLFVARHAGAATPASDPQVELNADGEIVATFAFGASAGVGGPSDPPAPLAIAARFLADLPVEAFCLLRVWPDPDAPAKTVLLMRATADARLPDPTRPEGAPRTAEPSSRPAP